MTFGREGRAARFGGAAVLAAALSLGVSAWEQFLHEVVHHSEAASARHFAWHVALAFPVALAAVAAGRLLGRGRTSRTIALLVAVSFTVLLVPAVMTHALMHPAATGLVHEHGALFVRWGGPASFPELLRHGVRDAGAGFPVALAIALIPVAAVRLGSRRRPVRPVAAGLAFCAALASLPAGVGLAVPPAPFSVRLPIPPTLSDTEITLVADETDVQIMPTGPATRMWTFNGTFPGPTIRRRSGQPTFVTVVNNLGIPGSQCQLHDPGHGPNNDMCLTLHHHGNHSAPRDDGQPDAHLIAPGQSRQYTYELMEDGAPERAAMQWYHDHRMDVTGRNVWMGLVGMVILDDDVDNPDDPGRLPLPKGAYELPLTVTDRTFDANNQLVYSFDREGVVGEVALVNGAPQPFTEVADRTYRLRILNASNAVPIDLARSDGKPLVHIGTESGLLEKPLVREHIPLGPAERADILVNFDGDLGKNVVLNNLVGFGATAELMQFRVLRDEDEQWPIPATLRDVPDFPLTDVAKARTWTFGRHAVSSNWTINGEEFDPARVDADPALDSTEVWTFVNASNVVHIVHIHDVDWKVLSRSYGVPPNTETGLDESGLKESFWLRPFEIVTVVSRFTDHLGTYVLHCHILEHEDRAMMAQFEVIE